MTYFTTDGCDVETVDFATRQRRPPCKADEARMARISDYLPSIGFIWSMVSAQDHGETAPLREIEAAWNNSVKHVQSETLMGAVPCRYAVAMAEVIAGSREEILQRPPVSLVVCTIALLAQDTAGIEGALVLDEAGLPVGFLAMPTLGTTAPATLAGTFAMGDAEIISAAVLMHLHAPGSPVFHSLMQAWADPRTGGYVSYSLDSRTRYAPFEIAHHWGMASLGACYGTDAQVPGWQSAAEAESSLLLCALTGAETGSGLGLVESCTLLYPESILLDADVYHRVRIESSRLDTISEALVMDVIKQIGPSGNLLAHKHTRTHLRQRQFSGLTAQPAVEGRYRDSLEVAREDIARIGSGGHFLGAKSTRDAARNHEIYTPHVVDRRSYESWINLGKPSMYSKAREVVAGILEEQLVDLLPGELCEKLDQIPRSAEKEMREQ